MSVLFDYVTIRVNLDLPRHILITRRNTQIQAPHHMVSLQTASTPAISILFSVRPSARSALLSGTNSASIIALADLRPAAARESCLRAVLSVNAVRRDWI
jgi:hypothetical protein